MMTGTRNGCGVSMERTIALFWKKVMPEPMSGCWLWLGALGRENYGQFHAAGKGIAAHRFSYELHKGAIPPGMWMDHLCRNSYCVNPDHLEPVTPRENTRRGNNFVAAKMNSDCCPRGHKYPPDALRTNPGNGFSYRRCVPCKTLMNKRRWAQKVAKRQSDAIIAADAKGELR